MNDRKPDARRQQSTSLRPVERTGIDSFIKLGYTHTVHLFIMAAEILGGASLLLPWRWLTPGAVAGLTIGMSGALLNHIRSHDSLDVASAAIVMVIRLLTLALLTVKGRWLPIAAGASARIPADGRVQLQASRLRARSEAARNPRIARRLQRSLAGWGIGLEGLGPDDLDLVR